jgi:hypothetical protein
MESFKDELVNIHQSFRAEGCYKSFAYMFAEFLSAFGSRAKASPHCQRGTGVGQVQE